MNACIQTVFYLKYGETWKENPYPRSPYPWKFCLHLLKVTRQGFLPARPLCFPHKSPREGHIPYNASALSGVNNSGRKTHSSQLDS